MIHLLDIDTTEARFEQRFEIENSEFVFYFDWNEYEQLWFVSISDANENKILNGLALIADIELLQRFQISGLPKGELVLVDSTTKSQLCGRYDLGNRFKLYYRDYEG